jgi:hypothetical protein
MIPVNALILFVLGHPALPVHLLSTLEDIFSLLEPLASGASDTLRPLAREARIVITARLASISGQTVPSRGSSDGPTGVAEDPQEVYQKALRLLQDPLLPVRAHGLMLLRQLVSPRSSIASSPALDEAFVPAVLSIFLQSIQDDDSYIYLNAVRGLSSMVDVHGKTVLRSLLDLYTDKLDGTAGSSMTNAELDQRLRVGEVLEQVIHRCGTALPAYCTSGYHSLR